MSDKKTSILKLTPEAKVGLFVLLAIILLVYMSLRIGGIKIGRAEGYMLYVDFDSAAGLDKDAAVRVAGVEVGRVKDISLRNNKAHLTLQIKPEVRIGKDFTAVLKTKGLLGEKYLELVPGSPNAPALKEGEQITHTTSYADMDKLINQLSDVSRDIKNVTESLSKVLGGPEGEQSLRTIVKNIEDISTRVNKLVEKNDDRINSILANLDQFSALLRNEGPGISAEIRLAAKNLNEAIVKTSANINDMVTENRGNLKEGVENLKMASLKLQEAMDNISKVTKEVGPGITETVNSVGSIAKKIDKGEGTLGKLVNDTTLHENINKTITGINNYIERGENFHTFIGYRAEYLSQATGINNTKNSTKSYFSLQIQPKADKYYLLEVINDPMGRRTTEVKDITVDGVKSTRTEVTTKDTIKFSAQIAKRFSDVTIRGGLIESTGGAGVDYNLLKDKFRLTFEAFDFGRKGNPHLKAAATYSFSKYFFITAGYDDFISRNGTRSPFAGAGFIFEDEDLKYLLSGGAASIATAVK